MSASIPLVLVWRDMNRRRSAALVEETRWTWWPRFAKNTAICSHAGPVGSIITSNRVLSSQPASAAVSTSFKLSTVGHALRFATTSPFSSSTRTVCADAMPRSIPTRRLSAMSSSKTVGSGH